MTCYQMFLFVLWVQAGSDCLSIFTEDLAQWRPGYLGNYCANFLFLDTICCHLQNALSVSFKLKSRAKSWLLEELGSPPIRVTADIAIVVSFTVTLKVDGDKAKLSMDSM